MPGGILRALGQRPGGAGGGAAVTDRVSRIAIVGRDAPLWIAALALQRALGPAGVAVIALELPSVLEPSDACATVPSLAGLHEMLGFDEAILAGLCDGVPLVGQRFANWSRTRHAFVQGYDAPAAEGDLFTQLWLKARSRGLQVAYEDFSLGAAAAKQGRVPARDDPASALAAGFGYQVGAEAYAGLLKHYAAKQGIAHRTGRLADVEMTDGRIAAIAWDSGERFEADLYVDASGAEAILIGRMPDDEWESWSEWLPCDQMLTASGPALQPLPGFAQLSAFRAGWFRLEPLQGRTALTACLSEEFFGAEMFDNLDVLAGIRLDGDAVLSPLDPGMRRRSRSGNCVALGEAAARLEPLHAASLHLVHVGVQQLVGGLVAATGSLAGLDGYHDGLAARATDLRDLQAAHYWLNRRVDDPFWDRARAAPAPPALAEKLAAFSATGQIPVQPHEALQADDWAAVFIGHGLIPDGYAPVVDQLPEQDLMAHLQQRLQEVARLVNAMPTVEAFIAAARSRREGSG